MRILVAAPLRLEAFIIARGWPAARVRRTGMGPRRARAAVSGLLEDPAQALLVMGFGGGLARDGVAGEVVVAQEIRGPSGIRVACSGAESLAGILGERGLVVRRGTIASVTRPAVGATRTRLHATGAMCCDMESVWLARGAGERPVAVLRVLSDTPTGELTVNGLLRACVTLRKAAAALQEWTPGE